MGFWWKLVLLLLTFFELCLQRIAYICFSSYLNFLTNQPIIVVTWRKREIGGNPG